MKNKDKKDKQVNKEYGEMIPTGFKWIGLEEQKKRANELNEITKKNLGDDYKDG